MFNKDFEKAIPRAGLQLSIPDAASQRRGIQWGTEQGTALGAAAQRAPACITHTFPASLLPAMWQELRRAEPSSLWKYLIKSLPAPVPFSGSPRQDMGVGPRHRGAVGSWGLPRRPPHEQPGSGSRSVPTATPAWHGRGVQPSTGPGARMAGASKIPLASLIFNPFLVLAKENKERKNASQ